MFLQSPKQNILVIGDSITADGRYVTALRKQCYCNIDAYGYVGFSSTKIRNKFEQIDLKKYDMVIFEMGINNIYNVNAIIVDFRLAAKRAHNAGLKVVALTLPPFKGYISWNIQRQLNLIEVNNWLLSDKSGVDYAVDIYKPLSQNDKSKHSKDGLHPDETGHKIIAQEIINTIKI